MATITREALDKQINRNRILSLILLFVFAAGALAALYYYNEAKENYRQLQQSKGIISEKDEVIKLQKQLNEEHEQTLKAVHLLKVFLDDDNTEKEYTEEEILAGLSVLAEKKEAEIETRNTARKTQIEKLFNKNSDPNRKAAQNTILRKYGNDKKLVSELLHYAMEDRVNQSYSGSISRTFEILVKLSSAALIENQKLVNEFIKAVENVGLAGPKVKGEINQILKKMRV